MARKLSKIFIPLVSLVFMSSLFVNSASAVTAADWKAGRIIDDVIFTNKNDMSVAQIQNFLNQTVGTSGRSNSTPGVCDNNGVQQSELGGGTRAQYGAAHGNPAPFTCLKDYYEVPKTDPSPGVPASNYGGAPIPAGAISAAQMIWNAAQRYNINPKVLLVTIQKESAGPLTTDDWPFRSQYTYAMGAHCPDSGPGGSANCDPNYAGFSIQISESASLFRYYLDNMNQSWWPYKHLGNNSILFNPNQNCGSSNVYIETMATAALYTYTPYQPNQAALNNMYGLGDGCSAYGNRNFWRIFNDWFGSTQFPQPIGGILYYQISTGKVYLVTTANSTRYSISSWAMIQNYRLDRYQIVPVDDTTLQQYTDGGELTSLVWDGSGVYLVNDGIKYHVPSSGTCDDWALACFDNNVTKQLGDTFQNLYLQSGTTIASLANYNSVFYVMQGGQRKPIANNTTFTSLGFTPQQALYLTAANVTQPLGNLVINTPTPISFGNSVFYFDGTNYHKIPSYSYLSAWGINNIFVPPTSAYNNSPPTSTEDLSNWYQDGAGNKYLIDHGYKILLDAQQQQIWPSAQYQTFSTGLAQNLSSDTLKKFVWSDPYLYMLENGTKHYVPTYEDYLALGVSPQNTTGISRLVMDSVTQGSNALGDGKIVGITNDSKLYVVNNHQLIHIPSPSMFNIFGFDWGKIYSYPNTLTSDYPVSSGSLQLFKASDGSYDYIYGNNRLIISQLQASDFGLNTGLYKSLAAGVTKNIKPGQNVTKFFYNSDDGKIYYGSGGALHYVRTYEAYVGYGGTRIPATVVNSEFISGFLIAQSI